MTYGIYKIYYTKPNGKEDLLIYTNNQKKAQIFKKNGYKVVTNIKAWKNFVEKEIKNEPNKPNYN